MRQAPPQRRLFERADHATGLRLVASVTTPPGLNVLTYAVEGAVRFDTYDPSAHAFNG